MPKRLPHIEDQPLNRKQLSHRQRDERTRRMLYLGAAVVAALVVLVLGWGAIEQYVLRPRKPVATVYGTSASLADYQKYYRYRYWDLMNYRAQLTAQRQQINASDQTQAFLAQYYDQQIQQIQTQIGSLEMTVLDEMIDDLLVRHEAEARGITVTPDEVQAYLEEQFGYSEAALTPEAQTPQAAAQAPEAAATAAPTVAAETPAASETETLTATETPTETPTPAPTPTPMSREEFERVSGEFFTTAQDSSGFTEADFRKLLEGALLRQKVQEAISAQAPITAEQVHARHILVDSREKAEEVLGKLNEGGDFAELAAEYSTDTATKDNGGDLGWFAKGGMVEAFDAAAFALQPGETSDVVETSYGFHVIRVEEREANRELEAADLGRVQQAAVSDWFEAQRASDQVVRSWDSTMVPRIASSGVAGN